MKPKTALDLIKTHGLSIRQIPTQVIETRTADDLRDGDELFLVEVKNDFRRYALDQFQEQDHADPRRHYHMDESGKLFRRYVRRVRIPANAGQWMSQQVTDTSSRVEWSTKRHNLAPTLEESVALCVKNLNHTIS